jgi:hypothetical protein
MWRKKVEDIKEVIKKIDNSMAKRKRIKREAMPYTTLHRKLNSVQYELHKKENGSEWNV